MERTQPSLADRTIPLSLDATIETIKVKGHASPEDGFGRADLRPATDGHSSADRLRPGYRMGRYRICSFLACGGMAELYLARTDGAAGIDKLVVIKRILPHLADDPVYTTMFLGEARLSARLSHSNIVTTTDVGIDDATGAYFMVMDHVHGVDLRRFLAAHSRLHKPVPLEQALTIIAQVVGALDYAHNLEDEDGRPLHIVHRDVSLSNILIGFDGGVRLIDFGVAKATTTTSTTGKTIKGKFAYMSPEQCQAHEVDGRSDVFAMGIVLYELTTMHRAYEDCDNDFNLLRTIVRGPAPKPSTVLPNYPADLEAVVSRALARSPDDRYQSVKELGHAVEQLARARRYVMSQRELGEHARALFPEALHLRNPARLLSLASLETTSAIASSTTIPSARRLDATPASTSRMRARTEPLGKAPATLVDDDRPRHAIALLSPLWLLAMAALVVLSVTAVFFAVN